MIIQLSLITGQNSRKQDQKIVFCMLIDERVLRLDYKECRFLTISPSMSDKASVETAVQRSYA